jgi:hypothetical protein
MRRPESDAANRANKEEDEDSGDSGEEEIDAERDMIRENASQ